MKRGRKPKNPGVLESVNPKVIREITGLLVGILAVILILAEFSAAGKFGATVFNTFKSLFGVVAYLFSFWVAFAAVMLVDSTLVKRGKVVFWGLFAFLILFAALIAPFGASGGAIGTSIFSAFQSAVGQVVTFILLLIGSIVSLLIVFNLSLMDTIRKITAQTNQGNYDDPKHARVNVFKAVRRRIGMKDKSETPAPPQQPQDGTWVFPSVELLQEIVGKAQPGNVAKNVEILTKTLGDFGVEVTAGRINVGPTVTQYELKPSEGVKLNTIKARSDDLALALAVHPVRVEAPIPGKSAVGVEVPNKEVARVSLRALIDSETFKKRKSNLSIPLGMDVAGDIIMADLKTMPHLLVAGATGSGKSVGLNSMLLSLLYQNSPRDLRVLLVDPKRVEFTAYNGIPHLLTPVVVDVDKTVNLLRWAIAEMERRFRLFEEVGSRDIESYNEKTSKGITSQKGNFHDKIPYIALVIDELADLMAQASNEVEAAVVRLAQLARATGIHLIVATQRPSVDVITGIIKANITSRVAFAVASQVDSRTIIDQSGADKLLGNGDMLFLGGEYTKPKRIQGAFVTEKDVKNVTDFLKSEGSAIYDQSVTEYREIAGIKSKRGGGGGLGGSDDMLPEAKQLVMQSGTASASFLQRRLKVGYARAARLLDLMEEEGIIGPSQGAKPRDILVDSLDEVSAADDTYNASSQDGFHNRRL
ncbi:MAG: DNA translocase FtsK 4TM domain-containing protein [Candidatus Berkelbacteria bacterium]|nr:DNA translocase FtsK 4TM domain-containing protein [Candidatus Berkelbacteria bacterium]